ncbi:MAG TPA: hypothetical protein VGO48_12480 [Conexibacter sp.]|jgi:hypothetical protein|nr:hypothetical protein [Conexibacter sp.]
MGRGIVTAPDGERWRVRRRWLDRPAPRPWTRWRRSRKRKDDSEAGGGWLSDAALTGVDSLGGLGLVIGAVVVIALLVFVLLPLIGIAFELALLIGFVMSGLFGRVVLRRPWTIEAVSLDEPGRRSAFAVTGWRRSRRSLAALASAIETTGLPSALPEAEPTLLDPAASST